MTQCTFEATPFYRGLLQEEFGLKEYSFSSGEVTLYLWKHPWYRRLVSTPYRDRLAISYEGDTPVRLNMGEVCAAFPKAPVVVKDVGKYCSVTPGAQVVEEFTNADVILDGLTQKRFSLSARQKVRQACEEHGLAVSPKLQGGLDAFYRMYLLTRRRLGVIGYPLRFFKALAKAPAGSVAVFTCMHQEKPVGYLYCYLHGREMISTHIAYEYAKRNLRITDYLFSQAFEWGKKEGFNSYRFGADNKEQLSLAAFKKKLGAQVRPQYDFVRDAGTFNASSHSLGMMKKTIRMMPLWIYRPFSASLSRAYFA